MAINITRLPWAAMSCQGKCFGVVSRCWINNGVCIAQRVVINGILLSNNFTALLLAGELRTKAFYSQTQ